MCVFHGIHPPLEDPEQWLPDQQHVGNRRGRKNRFRIRQLVILALCKPSISLADSGGCVTPHNQTYDPFKLKGSLGDTAFSSWLMY